MGEWESRDGGGCVFRLQRSHTSRLSGADCIRGVRTMGSSTSRRGAGLLRSPLPPVLGDDGPGRMPLLEEGQECARLGPE